MFIAFSGEELGLYGPTYFAKNPTIELEKLDLCWILIYWNKNNSRTLLLNGVGTSSKWESLVEKSNIYDFDLKTTPSGFGSPIIHHFIIEKYSFTLFYWLTRRLSKPSDDIERLILKVYDISSYVVNIKNSFDILDFDYVETKSESNETPSF